MSDRLREAARRLLQGLPSSAPGEVERLTIDISVGGRTEMVTISVKDGELHFVSTDGKRDGPHVQAALAFVAGVDDPVTGKHPRIADPTADERPAGPSEDLASAIDDLLTAITRTGVAEAGSSPSVDEALDRVSKSVSEPAPPGLVRFIGRLRAAIHYADSLLVARMLHGAALLASDLRGGDAGQRAQQRMAAWLGTTAQSGPNLDLLSDRTLVELGREWLWGTERASIERRYLVDLETGEVFREDRLRSEGASLGPSPRQLLVGLAEVQQGPSPRRIRVLQYAVHPEVSPQSWERIAQLAASDFDLVADRYRASLSAFPALSEPFTFIAPASYARDEGLTPLDGKGRALPIVRGDHYGVAVTLDELTRERDPLWLAGRLVDVEGTLMLAPFGFATKPNGVPVYQRLR